MISSTIKFLTTQINSFLQSRLDGNQGQGEKIISGNIVNQSGSTSHLADNVIIASLINIEEERTVRSQDIYKRNQEGGFDMFNPTQKLNLYILFSAHFEDYNSALRSLSEVVLFFEINKVFDKTTDPVLPTENLQKIVAEMRTLNFEEQNQLWGSLGAKYLPSVLYKIKTIGIVDIESKGLVKGIDKRTLQFHDFEEKTFIE